jgi:hypothetical protein
MPEISPALLLSLTKILEMAINEPQMHVTLLVLATLGFMLFFGIKLLPVARRLTISFEKVSDSFANMEDSLKTISEDMKIMQVWTKDTERRITVLEAKGDTSHV